MAATPSTQHTGRASTHDCDTTTELLKALHDDVIPFLSAALLAVGLGNNTDAETYLKKAGGSLQTAMRNATSHTQGVSLA